MKESPAACGGTFPNYFERENRCFLHLFYVCDKMSKVKKDKIKETEKEQKNTEEVKEKETAAEENEPEKAEKNDFDELIKAKEERVYGKDREEEPEEEIGPMTFRKKLEFFWEYYKWFVIIPSIIIVIVVVMIVSYLDESRERALELSIMNAVNLPELMYVVEHDYTAYTGGEVSAKDIRIESDLQYPNTETGEIFGDKYVISMQKFNSMVLASRVDVAVTNTWVANAYSVTDAILDLREIFDEEFLNEHSDIIYYSRDSKGEEIPVGFYVGSELFMEAYEEDTPPIVISFDSSKHPEEAVRFMEWIISE